MNNNKFEGEPRAKDDFASKRLTEAQILIRKKE